MIIDAHAHIFPDKIASRAADGISSFYDIPVRFDGSVGQLLKINRKAGVDRAIVQSVATVPEQVRNINNFISEQVRLHPEQLIGFGALHPDFPDIAGETERIISLGLRGIKLHSDFQRFNIDDPKAFPIYEAAEGRLPILFHCGDARYDYSSPKRLYSVMKRFPKLTIIGAHLAGWTKWDEAADCSPEASSTPTSPAACTPSPRSTRRSLSGKSAQSALCSAPTTQCGARTTSWGASGSSR